ncbi:TonB-dependent receptor [Sphingomonas suaedae]|uniref:TonB-dependent receptor n=1 Tax=Sphingomonas suaedae TaxID=2599297 RepID=A0A518RHL3_9SPHN|nr:TonB-dependent receptor [Sphingomonas suaedae]QDX26909.1 TonB-dependent receptor [Sphingomonas suaedae]
MSWTKPRVTIGLAAGVAALSLVAGASALHAQPLPAATKSVNIKAQNLSSALLALARQTRTQIVFDPAIVRGRKVSRIEGAMSAEQALRQLLAGTGLHFLATGPERFTVVAATRTRSPRPPELAQPVTQRDPPVGDPAIDTIDSLPLEIVVTARKRTENLIDVPVPVTALSGDQLAASSQARLENYFSSVPGLNLTKGGSGDQAQVSIRGISSGFSNPSVGIVIDDIPFGSSSFWGGGALVPDIDPGDLERVEILRGPQGTLYGSSSLGGLIKYVTKAPSTRAYEARLEAGVLHTEGGRELGYSGRASLNVPAGDTLAFRVSGFGRHEPGYIDNVATGQRDVNAVDAYGGRVSALWRPSDDLSIRIGAFTQHSTHDGASIVNTTLGTLQQALKANTGGSDLDFSGLNAVATLQLGSAEITSLTGYSRYRNDSTVDLGVNAFLGPLSYAADIRTDKFSQELRLALPVSAAIDWLIGGFYTAEDTQYHELVSLYDPVAQRPVADGYNTVSTGNFHEYAVFSNLTVKLSEVFDIQFGGRYARYDQSFGQVWNGLFIPSPPFIPPRSTPEDDAFTYLVTPRLRLATDLNLYARFASGYRAGGPNSSPTPTSLPTFKPDKARNYEIGLKGRGFGGAMSYDLSVYYIDWDDIQLQTFNPSAQTTVYVNGNRARSWGVEFSVEARPWTGLTVTAWGSWNSAELTEEIPVNILAIGSAGDALPFSQNFSGYASAEQAFQVGNGMAVFFGGSASYIDRRQNNFPNGQVTVRRALPSYTKVDLRAGLRADRWKLQVYADNVGDSRGWLAISPYNSSDIQAIRPRTIGASIAYDF